MSDKGKSKELEGINEPLGLGHAVHCAKSFAGNVGDDIVKAESQR